MNQIERIIHMNRLCIELQSLIDAAPSFDDLPPRAHTYYHHLSDYMSSSLWLQDYEADEQGTLPPSLRRAVLSQDTLYNLLQDYTTMQEKL